MAEHWEDWQKPYQFGTIVLRPPTSIRKIVNDQRQRYDPVSQRYSEAHISVTQPLRRQLAESEWDHLQRVLSGFPAFQIRYGPLNSFLPYPCIWYEIEPRERILELRQALHRTGHFNLDIQHPENFIPHMTITEGLSGPAVDLELLRTLQMESGTGAFLARELDLIVPDPEFQFQVHRTLLLGNPAKGS